MAGEVTNEKREQILSALTTRAVGSGDNIAAAILLGYSLLDGMGRWAKARIEEEQRRKAQLGQ